MVLGNPSDRWNSHSSSLLSKVFLFHTPKAFQSRAGLGSPFAVQPISSFPPPHVCLEAHTAAAWREALQCRKDDRPARDGVAQGTGSSGPGPWEPNSFLPTPGGPTGGPRVCNDSFSSTATAATPCFCSQKQVALHMTEQLFAFSFLKVEEISSDRLGKRRSLLGKLRAGLLGG